MTLAHGINTRSGTIMQNTDNPKKVFIRTFGCQMNEYDSDKMLDVLGQERGVVVTHRIDRALECAFLDALQEVGKFLFCCQRW